MSVLAVRFIWRITGSGFCGLIERLRAFNREKGIKSMRQFVAPVCGRRNTGYISGLAVLASCLSIQIAVAGTDAGQSSLVKLVLRPAVRSVVVGSTIDVQISLCDASNQNVKAPKDLQITVQAAYANAPVESASIDMKNGDDSAHVQIPATQAGILHVEAINAELLAGETFIRISSAGEAPHLLKVKKPPPPSLNQQPQILATAPNPNRLLLLMNPSIQLAATNPSQSGSLPSLQLFGSPSRELLADGNDAVTITAFLQNVPATQLTVGLKSTDGTLTPSPFVIPAGASEAVATLTSNYVCKASVSVVNVSPTIPVISNLNPFVFGPAISMIKVEADPGSISMLNDCDINVTLFGEDGKSVSTDVDRHVSLSVKQGNGQLQATDVVIKAGDFNCKTEFVPFSGGAVTITAMTPGLLAQNTDLQVTWPILVLTLSAIGGCLGGVVAFWLGKDSKWWRIAVGGISGLVFYWGFIFSILTHIVPRIILLNSYSAFALSVLGGWLGTKVFTILLKPLGFKVAP
jgi:hypothetical protein